MDENKPIEEVVFPEKPVKKDGINHLLKSAGSLILFITAYYFVFSKDINYILVLVMVIFIHEMGHFIAMRYFDYKDVRMFFIPLLGAFVAGEKHKVSQLQRSLILLAGPAPGILIGLVLYGIGYAYNYNELTIMANTFIFLNVFNLLPITPLDGGNLMETLFFKNRELLQTIFIILSAVVLAYIAFYTETYMLFLLPLFMLTRIIHQYKLRSIKADLDRNGINYNRPYEELTNKDYWLIRERVVSKFGIFKNVNGKEYSISSREMQIVEYIKSLQSFTWTSDMKFGVKVGLISCWILFLVGPLAGGRWILKYDYTINVGSEQYRDRMVAECIESMGDMAMKYDNEVREFCECVADTISKKFTPQELKEHKTMSEEKLSELYSPFIQGCMLDLQLVILMDSAGIQGVLDEGLDSTRLDSL